MFSDAVGTFKFRQGFSQFGVFLLLSALLMLEFSEPAHTSVQLLQNKVAIALSRKAMSKNLVCLNAADRRFVEGLNFVWPH